MEKNQTSPRISRAMLRVILKSHIKILKFGKHEATCLCTAGHK